MLEGRRAEKQACECATPDGVFVDAPLLCVPLFADRERGPLHLLMRPVPRHLHFTETISPRVMLSMGFSSARRESASGGAFGRGRNKFGNCHT